MIIHMWFHGFGHLLVWLFAACILQALHLSVYDLGVRDARWFSEDYNVSLRKIPSVAEDKRKILIVLVEGLNPDIFMSEVQKTRTMARVAMIEGIWGHVSWHPPPPGSIGFEPLFTGNPEGFGPSVLAMADRVTFIGKPNLARGLKISKNYTGTFSVIDPDAIGGEFTHLDLARDMRAITVLIDKTMRGEIWTKNKVSAELQEIVVLHLTAVGVANQMEGNLSQKSRMELQETLNHLEYLFMEITKKLYMDTVTHIVTSVGRLVPILAWGHGIETAKYPQGNLNPQNAWQHILSKPRDLEATSMAPLLACIMGGPPPPNSLARLPEHYLSLSKEEIGQCRLEYTEGIVRLFNKQVHEIVNGGLMRIASAAPEIISITDANLMYKKVKSAVAGGEYESARGFSDALASLCTEGIHHYLSIRSYLLSHVIFIMLTGSLFCSATLLVKAAKPEDDNEGEAPPRNCLKIRSLKFIPSADTVFLLLLALSLIVVGIDNFPRRYLFYVCCAITPWWLGVRNFKNWLAIVRRQNNQRVPGHKIVDAMYILLSIITGIAMAYGLPAMIMFLVSLVFLCFTSLASSSDTKVSLWLLTTLPFVAALSHTFDSDLSGTIRVTTALCWLGVSWLTAWGTHSPVTDYPIIVLNSLSALVIMFTGGGGGFYHISWTVLLIIPFLGSQNLILRLIQIFMALGVCFLLISTGGEPLSLIVFIVHTSAWMLAESYQDLKDLAVQSIIGLTGRVGARKFNFSDLRMNYFFNFYCMLSYAMVHSYGVKDKCTIFTPYPSLVERLLSCEIKIAVPVLAATVLYAHMIRRTGGSRYFSLLSTFLHFCCLIFCSFLRTYNFFWFEKLPTAHDLNRIHGPLNVLTAILFCSWIADSLIYPSLMNMGFIPRRLP